MKFITLSIKTSTTTLIISLLNLLMAMPAVAGENLFGKLKGAETLPENAIEFYQKLTMRSDKDIGRYQALDYETELEYGYSNQLSMSGAVKLMSLDTQGIIIDGYLPKDKKFTLNPMGVEASLKYMFLSPAKDDLGLAVQVSYDYEWLDSHSGQEKDTHSLGLDLLLQKYLLEGQLIWVGNFGLESTYADRAAIDDLPVDFEWPTDPEMEIEFQIGTGVSYRFAPGWFASLELLYETEFETEVGQERWSVFAGPSLHYGEQDWWLNLSWLPQLKGGGEFYPLQEDTDLHLIEKTKQEFKIKVGFNF